jgi:peptidoglycan/LPS O-acetylase OafA/YrhL
MVQRRPALLGSGRDIVAQRPRFGSIDARASSGHDRQRGSGRLEHCRRDGILRTVPAAGGDHPIAWRAAGFALVMATVLVLAPAACSRIFPALFPATSASFLAAFGELFPFQLPVFLVGILVFHLLRRFAGRLSYGTLCAGLCCSLVFMAGFPLLADVLAGRIHWTIYLLVFGYPPISYSLAFGAVAFCLAEGVGLFLVNAVIVHIGKVSYSAYFWHFAMLELIGLLASSFGRSLAGLGWLSYLATFALAAALSVAGATLTFLAVEQPMIRIGHRLAKALARQNTPMPSDQSHNLLATADKVVE